MKDKDYRKDWAQELALKKLREMRGEGIKLRWIAKELDVKPQFIGSILRKIEPKPVSEKVWLGMIAKKWITSEAVGNRGVSPTTIPIVAQPEGIPATNAALLAAFQEELAAIAKVAPSLTTLAETNKQLYADLQRVTAERDELRRLLNEQRAGK